MQHGHPSACGQHVMYTATEVSHLEQNTDTNPQMVGIRTAVKRQNYTDKPTDVWDKDCGEKTELHRQTTDSQDSDGCEKNYANPQIVGIRTAVKGQNYANPQTVGIRMAVERQNYLVTYPTPPLWQSARYAEIKVCCEYRAILTSPLLSWELIGTWLSIPSARNFASLISAVIMHSTSFFTMHSFLQSLLKVK